MSAKYRVKLENNRIVGPFAPEQIAELFERGHISDESPCQEFPAGDWLRVDGFEALKDAILKRLSGASANTKTTSEASIVKMMVPKKKVNKQLQEKLSGATSGPEVPAGDDEVEKLSEFKFEKGATALVDYDELEKRYQKRKLKETKSKEDPVGEVQDNDNEGFPSLEKTRVIKRARPDQKNNLDATRVIHPRKGNDSDEGHSVNLRDVIEERGAQVKEAPLEEENVDTKEATEFLNVGSMLPALREKAAQAEHDIASLSQQEGFGKNINENEDTEVADDEELEDGERKGMKPIVLIAFIVVFWFLFFDEEEKVAPPIAPQRVSIQFPSQSEYLDEAKSKQALSEGLEALSKQNYLSLVSAAKLFRISLFHKFQDNPALGHLIMVYARLYPNASSKLEASTTLFNLVRVAQDRLLTDPNIAIGTAEFYLNAKKYLTAVNTIENYLRVSKSPTVTMLSVYLEGLVKSGRLEDSREAFEKLQGLNPLPVEAYVNMAEYLELDEQLIKAKEIVERGLKSYPNSVRLLLKRADFLLRTAELKPYEETLKRIEELRAEQCPVYYASFLEHMGNASVLGGKFKLAANFYKESLDIRESPDLRTRLANLSVGGDQASQALIKESQIHELMKKARFAMKSFDWESAFVYAIEASDMNPLFIDSNLLLVEIQNKRGFYSAALATLLRLKKKFPTSIEINSRLVETYISSFRFNDAITTINEFAQIKDAVNTPSYASMLGRYYYASGNDAVAVKWLTEATNRDPLADDDLYLMARIYIKNGKYNDGKLMLSKALTLDPLNVIYQTLYAQVLYDQDGADTAIGYLRDIFKSNKDNPQILGEIAKYYYKSGQIKEFNIYRDRIEKLGTKDESFYRFMIYASEINQKPDKVLEYARELVKINPGDVVTYMKIGEYLVKQGRHEQAIEAYNQVKDRLESYPKINYLIAQAYFEMDNMEKAYEFAELEIKNNPKIPQGYFMAGQVLAKREATSKNVTAAMRMLERAVTIDYGYADALIALANLKRRQNSFDQARELLLRALKVEQNNPVIHRELGHVYRAVGQGSLAAESFKTYLTLLPSAGDRSEIEALIRASQ